MTGRKVFLELRIKVYKNWRDNPEALRLMGFDREKDQS
jgi:GTPase Era involved in 16S rRNA processing